MDRILKICLILFGIYWTTIADDSTCDDQSYYGNCQYCTENSNCPKCYIKNEVCGYDHKCRCKEGFARIGGNSDLGSCVEAAEIVEYLGSCNYDEKIMCSDDDDLMCEGGICICKRGFVRAEDVGKCIRDDEGGGGEIMDACSARPDSCKQTLPLKCDEGMQRCILKPGWYFYCNPAVYPSRYVKGTLKKDEQCDEDACIARKRDAETCFPCNPDLGLICRNGECDCRDQYYWVEYLQTCRRYREYNERCATVLCNAESNLECKNDKFCSCKEGFMYNEDKNRCTRKEVNVLAAVLGGILGFIILGLLIGAGVGVWLWRSRRLVLVHPGDAHAPAGSSMESKRTKDTKSEELPSQIESKQDHEIKIEP